MATNKGLAQGKRRARPSTTDPQQGKDTSGVYLYTGEDGTLLYKVVRRPGKKFHIERQANGGWLSGLGDMPRVLYNLPKVLEAARRGDDVYIVAGEKDADNINAQGAVATTNPLGEGKNNWTDAFSRALVGARAVVVWDRDDPGRSHALRIEASLKRVGVRARFRRALVGKDASDHLEAGHGLSELVRERPRAPRPTPLDKAPAGATPAEPVTVEPAVFQLALRKLHDYADEHGLEPPRKSDDHEWEACCPAHDDHHPSLGVRVGDDQPLVVDCQAGCTYEEVAAALGIARSDFSDHSRGGTPLEKEVQRQRNQAEARAIIAAESAPRIELPPVGYSLTEAFEHPPPETPFLIAELHPEQSNTVLVAEWASGKTTLLGNLAKSLKDSTDAKPVPFLNRFAIKPTEGKLAFLNYEMSARQFERWLFEMEIENTDAIIPLHLRGQQLLLSHATVADQLVDWLRANEVTAAILDPGARAWSGIVDNENSNSDMLRFTDLLDSIFHERAGVDDLFLAVHTGRGGTESRGAIRLQDWADASWYLRKGDDRWTRKLWAKGRDVEVDEENAILLGYNPDARTMHWTGVTVENEAANACVYAVGDLTAESGEAPASDPVRNAIRPESYKSRGIAAAESSDLIVRVKEANNRLSCHLTEKGREVYANRHRVKVNDDSTKNG